MVDDSEFGIVGLLVRVTSVSIEARKIFFQLPNGNHGSVINLPNLEEIRRGAVLILNGDDWDLAPADTWPEPNSISVVRRVLSDGTVLVDDGIGLKPIHNDGLVEVAPDNTVEYNVVNGIVRVVASTPLRGSLGREPESEDIERTYRLSGGGLGNGFSDFGGYPEVKARAQELIETQLERKKNLDKIKARPVKGVLFTGPPGTGKTHLARIIARESGAEFYLVSGPEIVSQWVGSSEDTLRRIFEAAANSKAKRTIVFFDEIDSIAERRGNDSHEASRRLVAQLLTLMDGFEDNNQNLVVIAATNRAEALDPALLRPGRFDWEIEFGVPDLSDRLEILRVLAGKLTTRGELPLEDLAVLTEGWSPADLTAIWTEAALVAAGDDRAAIAAEDVALAYERVAKKPRRHLPLKEAV